MLIIAVFVLSLNGCGYKASPFYTDSEFIGDENVEFKENNSSKR